MRFFLIKWNDSELSMKYIKLVASQLPSWNCN